MGSKSGAWASLELRYMERLRMNWGVNVMKIEARPFVGRNSTIHP